MKNIIATLIIISFFTTCKTVYSQSDTAAFDYFVRESNRNLGFDKEIDSKWREVDDDTVIYTFYLKGSFCDMPIPETMSMKIANDTLFYNFARYDLDCIGVAGMMIDFVLNKKKYPNYKDLVITWGATPFINNRQSD